MVRWCLHFQLTILTIFSDFLAMKYFEKPISLREPLLKYVVLNNFEFRNIESTLKGCIQGLSKIGQSKAIGVINSKAMGTKHSR